MNDSCHVGKNLKMKKLSSIILLAASVLSLKAEYPVNYTAEAILTAGSETFAPYYITANRHGVITQANGALLHAGAWRTLDTEKRFSYSFGFDLYGGDTNSTDYYRWQQKPFNEWDGDWYTHSEQPANFWIQQLYATLKYRSIYFTAGMQDRGSYMLNNSLSSGDMIQSGNARSLPELRIGFIDFQDVPFTNHWIQIQGEFAYGAYRQNKWLDNHFNNFSGVKSRNMLYVYKRIYFRTNPQKPFSATFGAQGAGQFGGTSYRFEEGRLTSVEHHSHNLDAFWQALGPHASSVEGYYQGQHLGSWDIKLRYRLRDNTELSAYVQNLWEDGSGMGKLNGWDGLWGIEYKAPREGWIDAAVIEYLQTTNQSGPIHWNPDDMPGTTLTDWQATGRDNYYNNDFYGSYANLGMAQGNPLLKSPIFNISGSLWFLENRVKALHVGVSGSPFSGFKYRVLAGTRTSWGSYNIPGKEKLHATCFLVEAAYTLPSLPAMNIKGELGIDSGKLLGNNVGACLTVSYKGLLNF